MFWFKFLWQLFPRAILTKIIIGSGDGSAQTGDEPWPAPMIPQRTHDAILTSLWRQNDVVTSFWRHNDVIITLCACWDSGSGTGYLYIVPWLVSMVVTDGLELSWGQCNHNHRFDPRRWYLNQSLLGALQWSEMYHCIEICKCVAFLNWKESLWPIFDAYHKAWNIDRLKRGFRIVTRVYGSNKHIVRYYMIFMRRIWRKVSLCYTGVYFNPAASEFEYLVKMLFLVLLSQSHHIYHIDLGVIFCWSKLNRVLYSSYWSKKGYCVDRQWKETTNHSISSL